MFSFLSVCCIVGIVHGQTWPNSTSSDVEIKGSIVAVSEVELTTNSTYSASMLGLMTPTPTEDPTSNYTLCPGGSSKPCVVKCCPLGESIGSNKRCQRSDLKFHVLFSGQPQTSNCTGDEEKCNYIIGDPCPYGKYRLEPRVDSNDEFKVLPNGSLWVPFIFMYPLRPHEYCLDVFRYPNTEDEVILPLVCFTEPLQQAHLYLHYILYPLGLLVSVPFLIVTMLVYCRIPELRDLHGKSLTCHVMCLTVAYIFLAAVQLGGETFHQKICVVIAFVIQFSFVACFFWLNVLCFDTTWNVFANVRLQKCSNDSSENDYICYKRLKDGRVNMPKATERSVFMFYSLYAWFVPLLFMAFSVSMDLMPTIPSSYLKPNFGEKKCWFSSEDAELHYFYGPVALLICVNIVLFILTAYKVFSFEWKAPKHRPRQLFRMCLSLFGVMGINWVMEIVSWSVGGPDYIWYITDVINTFQGVIIFCIFVLEPRVREYVWKKWGRQLSNIMCFKDNMSYSTPENAIQQNKA